MRYFDFVLEMSKDKLFVEVFCQKYKSIVVDVFPNTEVFPSRGLTYVFDNQLGRYNIERIKNILEE